EDSSDFYLEIGMMQTYYLIIRKVNELDIRFHRKTSQDLRMQRNEVRLCVAIGYIEEH
ncbi:unnamed protein product, partial [Rotaria sp. Silwood1]